jgi:hypothetical protein
MIIFLLYNCARHNNYENINKVSYYKEEQSSVFVSPDLVENHLTRYRARFGLSLSESLGCTVEVGPKYNKSYFQTFSCED